MTELTPELKATRASSFGIVAEEYEKYRPGYPMALVNDVCEFAGAMPGGRMLDVGAGTGKGARPFAARGLDVVALEPDAAMAAVLARELPTVDVRVAPFENCDEAGVAGPVDLLTSAQAWHWTDEATQWQRAHDLLRDGGTLALWWNHFVLVDVDAPAITAAYEAHAPHVQSDLGDGSAETGSLLEGWPGEPLVASGLFRDVEPRTYAWTRTMSRNEYLGLVDTQSPYRVLPDDVRTALFDDLRAVLPDQVTHAVTTLLFLARRA